MTAFTNGTQASLTLDAQDTLIIVGSCRLEITEQFQQKFETILTSGGTIGPFGVITQVILHGISNGSFTQQPANALLPVSMVDISTAQLAAPSAAQVAATNVLYQLNAAPYSIYQSNGTALVPFGGGGVSAFTSLTDAATANIPTANAPLAAALAAKADAAATTTALAGKADAAATTTALAAKADAAATTTALAGKQATLVSGTSIKTINGNSLLGTGDIAITGGGGSTSPTLVPYSSVIPLDGNKYSAAHYLTVAEALTVGATAEGGSYYVNFIGDGIVGHVPTLPAGMSGVAINLLSGSDTFNTAAYRINKANFGFEGGNAYAIFKDTGLFQATAPGVTVSPSLASATQGVAATYSTGTYSGYPAPTLSGVQWVINSAGAPTVFTPILGATGGSYTPGSGDVGRLLKATETYTNASGSATGTSNAVTVAGTTAPAFTAQSAPAGTVGTAYSYTFAASNTTSFAVASGSLPAGLSLAPSTGVLSGTPTTAATSTFVINAVGPGGTTPSTSQSVVVSAAGGSLSGVAVTNVSTNLTTAAYLDYVVVAGSVAGYQTRKASSSLIGASLTLSNASDNNAYASNPAVLSWTDGTPIASGGNSGTGRTCSASSAAGGGFQFTAPAGTTSRKCRIWLGAVNWSGGTHANVKAHLSDASATDVTVVVDSAVASGYATVEFTYTAASAGQTLTLSVFTDASNGAQVALFGAAYY